VRRVIAVLLFPWLLLDPATAASLLVTESSHTPLFVRRNLSQSAFDLEALAAVASWSGYPASHTAATWSRKTTDAVLRGSKPIEGLQAVSGRPFRSDPNKALAVVMDVHGVLLEPAWKDAYALAYHRLKGVDLEAAMGWVLHSTVHVAESQIFNSLAAELGKTPESIDLAFRQAREDVCDTYVHKAMERAREAMSFLRDQDVPAVLITGSGRAVIVMLNVSK